MYRETEIFLSQGHFHWMEKSLIWKHSNCNVMTCGQWETANTLSVSTAKAFCIPVYSVAYFSHILVPSFYLNGSKVRCHPHWICLEHFSSVVGLIIVWRRALYCCFRQILQNRALRPRTEEVTELRVSGINQKGHPEIASGIHGSVVGAVALTWQTVRAQTWECHVGGPAPVFV